jgi:hypothetical protein
MARYLRRARAERDTSSAQEKDTPMNRLALVPFLSIFVVIACGDGSGAESSSSSDSVKSNGCEKAGGSCVALAPGACTGTVMSSTKYSCEKGGAIGLECCMPSAPGSCSKSSDCSGALPRNEEKCADGSFSGAKWECLRLNGPGGFCSISYCEDHGGTGPSPSGGSGTCNQPSDCMGALPRNEIPCADGSSSGAQWDCDSNVCTISYCDNDGGPASSSSSDGGAFGGSDAGGGGGDWGEGGGAG